MELLCLSSDCLLNKLVIISRFNSPLCGIKSPEPKCLPNTGNLQQPHFFETSSSHGGKIRGTQLAAICLHTTGRLCVQYTVNNNRKTYSALDVIHGQTPLVPPVVLHHRFTERRQKRPLDLKIHAQTHYCRMLQAIRAQTRCLCGCVAVWFWWWCCCDLMAKEEPRDSGDELSHEDQTQEDGILQGKRQRPIRIRQ